MGTTPSTPPSSLLQANKALVHRFMDELMNRGNEEYARQSLSPDFLFYFHVRREPFKGYGPLFQAIRGIRSGFSDFRIDIQRMVAEDDAVMTYGIISGTYDGRWGAQPLEGFETLPPTGLERVPPTGRRFVVDFFSYSTIAEGKITTIHTLPDAGDIPVQLGVLPSRSVPAPLIWILRVRKALGWL